MSESPQASNKRFRFHHFDEASEVGLEDPTNGERVRQHKRRGRKPNPPTAEERREQNRAAQRAFREREQAKRMEKEQAWQAMEQEVERLKQRVAQAEYEANYLRGCVLLLSLISLVERGSVPQIYTETRLFPVGQQLMMVSPRGKRDSLHAIPAILQNILDASKHVLSFKDALVTALSNGCAIPTLTMPKDDENSSPKEDENSNTSTSAGHATPGPATTTTTTTTTASAVHAPSSSSSGSKRTRAQTWRSSTPESVATPSTAGTHPSPPSQPDMPGPSIHVERSSVPIRGTLTETPRPKTADDLAHLPALQALHIQRLQLKISSIMGDSARVTLTPTALQRLVPHDLRIDYIPAPSMRDRMILFQGLYDADDCFELLASQTIFIGGDFRNKFNWKPPPEFSDKYWFISHVLVDVSTTEYIPQAVERLIIEAQRLRDENSPIFPVTSLTGS